MLMLGRNDMPRRFMRRQLRFLRRYMLLRRDLLEFRGLLSRRMPAVRILQRFVRAAMLRQGVRRRRMRRVMRDMSVGMDVQFGEMLLHAELLGKGVRFGRVRQRVRVVPDRICLQLS